jgi:predicted RNA-binding Zn-ribbon protein involved in translation (DUF1610 family)
VRTVSYPGPMQDERDAEPGRDDRPPICPSCGVTQGFVVEADRTTFVCLECGFSDDASRRGRGDPTA